MSPSAKNSSLEKRLHIMSNLIRLGHESFEKNSSEALFLHILNNSPTLFPFERSTLLDCRNDNPEIVGLTGQSNVNKKSEYCKDILRIVKSLTNIDKASIIEEEYLIRNKCSDKIVDLYKELFKDSTLLIIPLRSPKYYHTKQLFLWLIEFKKPGLSNIELENLFSLLATHYNEALWHILLLEGSRNRALKKRFITLPRSVFLLILAGFIISLFFKVRMRSKSDFKFVPKNQQVGYAPYSGTIKKIFHKSGDQLKDNDPVIVYDSKEIQLDKALAQGKLLEVTAELDLAKSQSFSDIESRRKVKLLQLRKQQQENKLKKLEWFLSRNTVKAGNSGLLLIEDQELLPGRKVTAGEKLFEIISASDIEAEVYINEKDASVMSDGMKVILFPNASPETMIFTKILNISPVPLLIDNNEFCYIVRVKLLENNKSFLSGMRGTSNIYGSKVSLGYYLFRSLILWWRKQ